MPELELVGLDPDSEHIVLRGDDDAQFTLTITEALRTAVRRGRVQPTPAPTDQPVPLTPREIQARIRAGETAAEIAASADVTVQHVRRFEGPVLDEREYHALQARSAPVGREADAPALGDLVADRLAARGVDLGSLVWDAVRERSGPWVVVARFAAAGHPVEARWTFDPTTKALTATEDEARWLSETEIAEPPVRRHLTAVRPVVYDLAEATTDPSALATAALLDELGSRRGKRQPVDLDLFDPDEDMPAPAPKTTRRAKTPTSPTAATKTPTGQTQKPAARTTARTGPRTGPTATARAVAPPDPEPAARSGATSTTTSTGSTTRARRKGRAKVPSWEEIVFGAKPDRG